MQSEQKLAFAREVIDQASSFVPQGDHGIDLRGAARGNVAREQRGEQEHRSDRADGCGIDGIDLI